MPETPRAAPGRHRRFVARARLTIAGAAVGFLVAQGAVRVVVAGATDGWRFPEAAAVLADAERLGPDVDVLLLGSSRLGSFIDLETLTRALEPAAAADGPRPAVLVAAVPAADAVTMDHLATRILARGVTPAVTVVEVSAELLTSPPWFFAGHITRQLSCGWVVAHFVTVVRADVVSRALSSCLIPAYLFRGGLLASVVGHPAPYLAMPSPAAPPLASARTRGRANGLPMSALVAVVHAQAAVGAVDPEDDRGRRQHVEGELEERLARFESAGIVARAFDSLLARLDATGTSVLFVRTPVASALRAHYRDPVERDFLAFLQARMAGRPATLVDLTAAVPDAVMRDVHHGDFGAAAPVSRRLGAAIGELTRPAAAPRAR